MSHHKKQICCLINPGPTGAAGVTGSTGPAGPVVKSGLTFRLEGQANILNGTAIILNSPAYVSPVGDLTALIDSFIINTDGTYHISYNVLIDTPDITTRVSLSLVNTSDNNRVITAALATVPSGENGIKREVSSSVTFAGMKGHVYKIIVYSDGPVSLQAITILPGTSNTAGFVSINREY